MPDWNMATDRAAAAQRAREELRPGDRVRVHVGRGQPSVVVCFEGWSPHHRDHFETRTYGAVHPADITHLRGRPVNFVTGRMAA